MRQTNARSLGAINLRAQFGFNFGEFGVLRNRGCIEGKIAVWVQQAVHLVFRAHRSPAKSGPLAVESLVNSDIGVGGLPRPLRDPAQPREGYQAAALADPYPP